MRQPSAQTDSPPPNDRLYLALDQGGSRSRALVFDHRGQQLAQAEQAISTHTPKPGQVEHPPQQLVDSLRYCAASVVSQLTAPQRRRLYCWGLACQRASLLAWDRISGKPLTPVLSWQDCRGQDLIDWDTQAISELQQRTGLHPSHHHGVSKMRWCLEQVAAVKQAATRQRLYLAPLASYLAMALTRGSGAASAIDTRTTAKVDACSAQRTLLWNIHSQDWDQQLLSRYAIERSWLPAVAPCRGDWGTLQLAGLSLPGHFVGGDQGCGHFGYGKPAARSITINLGTGGFICLPATNKTRPPPGLLLSLASSDSDHQQWMLEGTINGVGAALSWLQQQYPTIDLQPFYHQPLHPCPGLFINTVSGLGSPFWRNDLNSVFIDSDSPHQRYSAVIDSIVFLIQIQLQRLQQAGCVIDQVELAGGVSQVQGLAQRLANLSGLPVTLHTQAESTARGLAYLLADQPQHWKEKRIENKNNSEQMIEAQHDSSLQLRYSHWHDRLNQLLV
jgi:glycerol kinase